MLIRFVLPTVSLRILGLGSLTSSILIIDTFWLKCQIFLSSLILLSLLGRFDHRFRFRVLFVGRSF